MALGGAPGASTPLIRRVGRGPPSEGEDPVPVVKVMSWNVRTLGDAKATTGQPPVQSQAVAFMALAIAKSEADLVGVMEVQSGIGAQLGQWLTAALNGARPNGAGYTWTAAVSSRQDGSPFEEYLLLWKNQANMLTLDRSAWPGPTWLIGVVDDNVLEPFFTATGYVTPADRNTLYLALATDGYIVKGQYGNNQQTTSTWRVVPDTWNALFHMQPPQVSFSGTVPLPHALSQADLQNLAARLLGIDILQFLTYGGRSPFVANFLVGAGNTKLAVGLYHAPGTDDQNRFAAINVIALSDPLESSSSTDSLLLMGDFNVGNNMTNSAGREYGRFSNFKTGGHFIFGEIYPAVLQTVFAPITGQPLNAANLLPNQLTSLVNTFLPNNAAPDAILSAAYDKFFFHSAGTVQALNPRVINTVRWLDSSQKSQLVYNAALAQAAVRHFRAFAGPALLAAHRITLTDEQTDAGKKLAKAMQTVGTISGKITKKTPANSSLFKRLNAARAKVVKQTAARQDFTDQITALDATALLLNNAVNLVPTGIGSAHTTYRYGISDHLPIIVNVTV